MAETVYRIKRLRKARCTVLLVVLMMLMMLIFGSFHKAAGAEDMRLMSNITVCQGDTLWSLVQEHYQYQGDIRKAIYEVKQINGLADAVITPGQILRIPQR